MNINDHNVYLLLYLECVSLLPTYIANTLLYLYPICNPWQWLWFSSGVILTKERCMIVKVKIFCIKQMLHFLWDVYKLGLSGKYLCGIIYIRMSRIDSLEKKIFLHKICGVTYRYKKCSFLLGYRPMYQGNCHINIIDTGQLQEIVYLVDFQWSLYSIYYCR